MFFSLSLLHLPSDAQIFKTTSEHVHAAAHMTFNCSVDGADRIRFPLITCCHKYTNPILTDVRKKNIKTCKSWRRVWRVRSLGCMLRAVTTKREDLGFNPVSGPFCVEFAFGVISVGDGFSQAHSFSHAAAHPVEKTMIIKSQYSMQWPSLWESTREYMPSY